MKRWKRNLIAATLIVFAVFGALVIWISVWASKALGPTETAQEIADVSNFMKHLDPAIEVYRGFDASSYGGLHGDGASIRAYLIDPNTTDALIAGLKRFHEEKKWHEYTWTESSHADLAGLEHLLPDEFLPKGSRFIVARRRGGRTIIDPKHGQVYHIDIRS